MLYETVPVVRRQVKKTYRENYGQSLTVISRNQLSIADPPNCASLHVSLATNKSPTAIYAGKRNEMGRVGVESVFLRGCVFASHDGLL